MASLTNLRNALADLVPSWLSEGDGGKVLHAIALMIDASVQIDRQRTELRFPRRTSPSANRLTGLDRGIQQGRSETAAHYAERLIKWRYPRGHRVRGNAWGVLEQVSEYFGGVHTATNDVKGNQFDRFADGTEAYSKVAWAWDAVSTSFWGRFWITIFSPGPDGPITLQRDLSDPLVWSDGTIGLRGMTAQDAIAIRNLFNRSAYTTPWHPENVTPEWVIVGTTGVVFTPLVNYTRWSANIANTQVAIRDPNFRYFSLTAHPYTELATTFVANVTKPDGLTYAGAAVYTNPLTFPDGTVHADKVSPTFVTGVLLPDDASAVLGY